MEINESQIVERCQRGEYELFGELYAQYIKPIYNFIYFRTHHTETAEDLTSLVFTKALENIRKYDATKGKFSTWLYQIARNSIIDHYRAGKSTEDIENAFDIASSVNIEKDVDIAVQMEKVQQYLSVLPKQQRDIVIMRVWDGLSHKEIAEILNITEANSKMIFSRVLGKMNKEMVIAITLLTLLTTNRY